MANINVVVDKPIADGYKLKFRTPCDSTVIEGLEVKYPVNNGVGSAIKKFVFKDAHGTELSGVGNLFVSGVMIEVLLDVTLGVAYIQNADTNSYVESVKGELQRIEESQKQFLSVAGKAVEECENIADSAEGFEAAMVEATRRAESVHGVYVGSGNMPDGYTVQIDPSGESGILPIEWGGTGATTAEGVLSALGLTATADEINKLDGLTATTAELNYLHNGVPISRGGTGATTATNARGNLKVPKSTWLDDGLDIDNLSETGFYLVLNSNISANKPFGDKEFNIIHIDRTGSTNKIGTQIAIRDDIAYPCMKIRKRLVENWGEWAWVNPPMVSNTEYRTTELYNGNPVYRKLVTYKSEKVIGDENGSTNTFIAHSIDNFGDVVRCSAMVGGNTVNTVLPYLYDNDVCAAVISVGLASITLYVSNKTWAAGTTFYFDLCYTKS